MMLPKCSQCARLIPSRGDGSRAVSLSCWARPGGSLWLQWGEGSWERCVCTGTWPWPWAIGGRSSFTKYISFVYFFFPFPLPSLNMAYVIKHFCCIIYKCHIWYVQYFVNIILYNMTFPVNLSNSKLHFWKYYVLWSKLHTHWLIRMIIRLFNFFSQTPPLLVTVRCSSSAYYHLVFISFTIFYSSLGVFFF